MDEKKQDKIKEEIRTYIMTDIPTSGLVNKKIEEAYQEIRMMQKKKTKLLKKETILAITGCAAAIVFIATTYCIYHPTLAAQLPFIGHIFEELEQKVSYPGNYSENAVTLPEYNTDSLMELEEKKEQISLEENGTKEYYVESGDLSVTLSEVTYDSNAIYLAVLVENKAGFAKDAQSKSSLYLNCQTEFYRMDGRKEVFREEDGNALAFIAEGEFVDQNTFKGLIQLTAMDLDVSKYTECDITFSEIKQELTTGEKRTGRLGESGEEISYIEYDWQKYKGTWKFHLDFNDLVKEEQEIIVNDRNEQGFGIEKIVKTSYEMYAVLLLPEGENEYDYIVTIWDANNQPLESHGSYFDRKSIYGRDVSEVTIYILKEEDFWESKGKNSYLQPEKAIYTITVECE